ncbi:calcium-translocating P-type ATPase, PMCA-type [Candidatus Uabimicrobium sp. HlEnr_7]|uniref:calcium-translocating P-type ATPase, PMCA-type n=1 Tax=Candidatus Uabimicrobium helgolandensis TaxID=3095367 RepID=UPI003557F545
MSDKHLKGLTDAEVIESREKNGANVLTPPPRDPWWRLFLEKFEDPVIRILIIAAVLSIAIGVIHEDYTEGIAIVIAIILATGIAFINEYRANAEFDILNQVNNEIPIEVIRNGKFMSIPMNEIVVNDILLVNTGQEIPADTEVLKSANLQVSQAKLTGESHPIHKCIKAESQVSEPYPDYMLYKGTVVVDGHATLRVTAVGDHTEIGKTARDAAVLSGNTTPLNKQLAKLSRLIEVVAFSIAAAIFIALIIQGVSDKSLVLNQAQWIFTGLSMSAIFVALTMMWAPVFFDACDIFKIPSSPPKWLEKGGLKPWIITIILGVVVWGAGIYLLIQNKFISSVPQEWITEKILLDLLQYFMIAVTIIVVAVPEGLALSVTLCLAYSMRKLIANNNLVRKMHACETIGAATVICSDKTGTLTQNNMHVTEFKIPYKSDDKLKKDEWIVRSIAINSTANLDFSKSQTNPNILGNPTEGALLLWLHENDVDYLPLRKAHEQLKEWSFNTERKYMATIAKIDGLKNPVLFVKGAPEIVLGKCSLVETADKLKSVTSYQKEVNEQLVTYQDKGMRTIGFAYKEIQNYGNDINIDKIVNGMNWLGFTAISDPIRPDVPDAISVCMRAGVDIKIVTGDNEKTAREIAKQINLWEDEDNNRENILVSGHDFEEWDDEKLQKNAKNIKVLYRARPANKLRLVKNLQEQNEVVAVTGDGVNDAPALNHADVGLAMGKCGTSIAKEASDIVLLDDSFTSITKAILWGRSLFQNIQRFLIFQLTINVAALGIALLGPFVGTQFPLTVMQMLWVNLIMDTFAALALATEPPNEKLMNRSPRHPDDFIIDRTMTWLILGGGFVFICVMLVFMIFYLDGGTPGLKWELQSFEYKYRLTIFFNTFIFLQLWNMLNAKAFGTGKSVFATLFKNKAFLAVAAIIIVGQILMVQFGGTLFRTVPLQSEDWLKIIGYTSIVLWIGEGMRLLFGQKS